MNSRANPTIRSLHVNENSTLEFNSMEEVTSSAAKFGFEIGDTVMVKGLLGIDYITLKSTNEGGFGVEQPGIGWWVRGEIQGYALNKFGRIENTIEELVNNGRKYKVGDVVELLGYYSAGDGAGHKRKITSSDDGSGVQLTGGLWACIVHNGEVHVSWFGAETGKDISLYLQKSINYNNFIFIDLKECCLNSTVFVNKNNVNIRGEGCLVSLLGSYYYYGVFSSCIVGENFNNAKKFNGFSVSGLKFICSDNTNIDGGNVFYIHNVDNQKYKYIYILNGLKSWMFSVSGNELDFSEINTETTSHIVGNDGIHVLSGTGIRISDCSIHSGDDCLSFTFESNTTHTKNIEDVYVSDCVLRSGTACGIKIETRNLEKNIFIKNMVFNNIEIAQYKDSAIGINNYDLSERTKNITDLFFSNINISLENESYTLGKGGVYARSTNNLHISNLNLKGRYVNGDFSSFTQEGIWLNDVSNAKIFNADIYSVERGLRVENSSNISFFNFKLKKIRNNIAQITNSENAIIDTFVFDNLRNSDVGFNVDSVKKMNITNIIPFINETHSFNLNNSSSGIVKEVSEFGLFRGNSLSDFNIVTATKTKNKTGEVTMSPNIIRLKRNTVGESYIDFINSNKEIDYDCRIFSSGGESTNGGGILGFKCEQIRYYGDLGSDRMLQVGLYGELSRYSSILTPNDSGVCVLSTSDNKPYFWRVDRFVDANGNIASSIQQLNTPYHATKMQQEGVYEDFIQYMDAKTEYDAQQREAQAQQQAAFEQREDQNQTYEEWLSSYPMLLPAGEEPQPSEALVAFKTKYLG